MIKEIRIQNYYISQSYLLLTPLAPNPDIPALNTNLANLTTIITAAELLPWLPGLTPHSGRLLAQKIR